MIQPRFTILQVQKFFEDHVAICPNATPKESLGVLRGLEEALQSVSDDSAGKTTKAFLELAAQRKSLTVSELGSLEGVFRTTKAG